MMRDRTATRNYSAERDAFRREHERHREWGLQQRHAAKLRRAQRERTAPPTALTTRTDQTRPTTPTGQAPARQAQPPRVSPPQAPPPAATPARAAATKAAPLETATAPAPPAAAVQTPARKPQPLGTRPPRAAAPAPRAQPAATPANRSSRTPPAQPAAAPANRRPQPQPQASGHARQPQPQRQPAAAPASRVPRHAAPQPQPAPRTHQRPRPPTTAQPDATPASRNPHHTSRRADEPQPFARGTAAAARTPNPPAATPANRSPNPAGRQASQPSPSARGPAEPQPPPPSPPAAAEPDATPASRNPHPTNRRTGEPQPFTCGPRAAAQPAATPANLSVYPARRSAGEPQPLPQPDAAPASRALRHATPRAAARTPSPASRYRSACGAVGRRAARVPGSWRLLWPGPAPASRRAPQPAGPGTQPRNIATNARSPSRAVAAASVATPGGKVMNCFGRGRMVVTVTLDAVRRPRLREGHHVVVGLDKTDNRLALLLWRRYVPARKFCRLSATAWRVGMRIARRSGITDCFAFCVAGNSFDIAAHSLRIADGCTGDRAHERSRSAHSDPPAVWGGRLECRVAGGEQRGRCRRRAEVLGKRRDGSRLAGGEPRRCLVGEVQPLATRRLRAGGWGSVSAPPLVSHQPETQDR